ncbi:hypothetical protein [Sinomonas sp. G460-2]|uniref:hypothetical protein n=1 Tax=Sinomonas sp. G460-2 TaxID=3393464 RepID=UPI0039EE5C81
MNASAGASAGPRRLEPRQRAVLVRLVGEDVAREDEPAVAQAYADFRAAMDALRRGFDESGSRD